MHKSLRLRLGSAVALALTSAVAVADSPTAAPPAAATDVGVTTAEVQASLTPDAVLTQLQAGNERYASGQLTERNVLAQVAATATGQYPKAVILSCLDSRIVPELVFDQGIGDLFVARVAGNIENADILGSMEFATHVAGARLIVVLGHTECGAIKGACNGVEMGNLTALLSNMAPAIEASRHVQGDHNAANHAFVEAVTHANVDQTVRDITERSEVLSALVADGRLRVVGATYDLATGRVTWH